MEKLKIGAGACGFHCIKVKDFSVRAGSTMLLEHINLHIHCGRLTVIIGRNGAGKSTLIKAMLGEIHHEGTIHLIDLLLVCQLNLVQQIEKDVLLLVYIPV